MKILFPTIAYNINGSSIYNDIVNCLNEHGHEIIVCRSDSSINEDNLEYVNDRLKILHVKTNNQFEKNLIKKGVNMLLLEKQFIRAIKKELVTQSFDLILYATPPISLNGVISYCKSIYGAKAFLMLKDIFPQNAVDIGLMKYKSFIWRYMKKKEIKLYNISDYIGCMSKKNQEYLRQYGDKIYSKSDIFYNSVKINDELQFHSQKDEKTRFLFGGNIGKPQNIGLLIEIIEELRNYNKAQFIIAGKGTEEIIIQEYAQHNQTNFQYFNYLPKEEYEALLDEIDIGLIMLDPRFTIANIPSKLPMYYNHGKPVLAITDTFTDLKEMITDEECGWWCSALDKRKIIELIISIAEGKDEQLKKGKNAYNYAKKHFDVEKNVEQIEKFMEVV